MISIHASREGSDYYEGWDWSKLTISIHASRGGSDQMIQAGIAMSH